jgi:N-acetylmuramoyl-L-alanine amidase
MNEENYRESVHRSKSALAFLAVIFLIKVGYVIYQRQTSPTPSNSTSTSITAPPSSTSTSLFTTTTIPSGVMATAVLTSPTRSGPLDGKIVVIDPGHNGANWMNPSIINRLVPDGRGQKACDTTGTATNSGYAEAAFAFTLALRVREILLASGATVQLTRGNNSSVGPCVDTRAEIGNTAHGDVALSLHGDGGPSAGHGFAVLVPVSSSTNSAVVASSREFGQTLVNSFTSVMPVSDYLGSQGIQPRSDLAGLNLTKIPKVLIECGNMRNTIDAGLMQDGAWQERAAQQIAQAITKFLTGS